MNEHEYWNELGNLYFISGAYEPAIHAYARSIELERGFGRAYSNMALAFVQTGQYSDAIDLYHRSIELLSDPREKAITWNRLGILYRQIKDYQGALVAYEQADKLDSRQDDMREGASRDSKYPLAVSMPSIDLKAILEKRPGAETEDENLAQYLNEELETAATGLEIDWFQGTFVPPNPAEHTDVALPSDEQELIQQVGLSMEEEGWIPLVFEDAVLPHDSYEMATELTHAGAESPAASPNEWQSQFEELVQINAQPETPSAEIEFAVVNQEQTEPGTNETASDNQWTDVSGFRIEEETEIRSDQDQTEPVEAETPVENQWVEVSMYQDPGETDLQFEGDSLELADGETAFETRSVDVSGYRTVETAAQPDEAPMEVPQSGAVFEIQSEDANNYETDLDLNSQSTDMTGHETGQYSQVEYPLVELSPAEINSIQIDVARFKRILQINPKNPFAWDTLGGLYKALGKFKDAITSYQQAIALDSTKPSYYYQLGLMYSAEKRDQEAMDTFQHVLSVAPQHTLANASLGSLYRKMGLNDLAQKHIDIALKDVYDEENEYNQACLEAICGNTDRALELLQVAIEDNPSYINWAQRDPDLDVLHHDERFHVLLQSLAQTQ